MPSDPTLAEYMIVALAQGLNDNEWGACGAYSEIPMAAFMLARREHAPNLWWMSGGGGAINPHCTLVESSSSYSTHRRAEAVFTIEDIVDFEFGAWRRMANVGLFGGIQVDRRGNVNMVGIGDYPRLSLRGPGTVGLAFAAHFHRTMIYLHDHNERVLCEQVAYVSAPGHSETRDQHTGRHSHGPERLVTPQAVFGFNDQGVAELRSITPGYAEAEVRDKTGFDYEVASDLTETVTPTSEQVAFIREDVDPHGLLSRVKLGTWR